MGFFDLNIPYLESSPSTDKTPFKAARTKLVIKAMELGYTGIAYNNTIKGVMSDHDRCAVSLLTLSSLLKLVPSLASSVNLHRDLLGVPRASPFRQYTRLTVCVESPPQAQALNSGNPILKTYDLVAVRPLNQVVFDQACEKSEVDIIAIDFSEKLPFRLKLPMVKAAIERGVYFEITYSNLIADVQTRRQMISNAKLLVDWTRGKNLIFSSAAPSVNELRGPYDVANLSSLLGLSMERAKAAISKNCRTLIANALRRKHFYKDAIRVEVLSSEGQLDCNKPLSGDWFKWDPISSGEGDLLLENMAKSFPASNKVSKTVKAIDFASIINGMTSHGFQVNALTSQTEGVPQPPDNGNNFLPAAGLVEVAAAASGQIEQLDRLDLLTEPDPTSSYDSPLIHQTPVCEDSQNLFSPNPSTGLTNSEEIRIPTTASKEEKENLNGSDVNLSLNVAEKYDFQLQKSLSSCESNIVPPNENAIFHALSRDLELAAPCDAGAKVELATVFEVIVLPASKNEESQSTKNFGVLDFVMDGERMEVDMKNKERTPLDTSDGSFLETEQFREPMNGAGALTDCLPISDSSPEMTIIGDSSIAKHESTKVTMEEKRHGESDTEANQTLVQSISGRSRPRSRTSHGAMLFPLNRLLITTAFKRKPRR
ncbi:protein GAMETOPHYTE DEFECTIVE 1 [Juglans microcarpa x Juglans regia]|uniref:protein GAMETOPHYTE DEFECTIVE 1 n=1 Tax=Juglans microcarpa x Juglans regia TaxID=2249226 RepID=UPI001B7E51DF|nr:protein GAMETOPHYTE DEFECTIVE 1 [Juglans microcarpa x Juglans regia]